MIKSVIFHVLAFITGFFAAFFTILPSIFSDSGSTGERIFTFILVLIVYLIISVVYGFINRGRRSYISLLIPGLILVILFTISDTPDSAVRWLLHMSYIFTAMFASVSGDRIGGLIKIRKERSSKNE